jgi:Holliday junction DNA helicase RuvA
MIGKLKGAIEIISKNQAIIDVGGVGYLVSLTSFTISKLIKQKTVELIIETQVKDDAIRLFGFLEQEERRYFLALLKINGISHTLALNILSFLSPEQIIHAVRERNKAALVSVPGIGSKMAARIVNELVCTNTSSAGTMGGNAKDAIAALTNLGYKQNQASEAVAAVKNRENMGIDEIICGALKELN